MAGLYSLATIEEHLNMGKSKLFFHDIKDSVSNSFDSRGHMVLERIAENEIGATLEMYIKNINANLAKTDLRPNLAFHDKLMDLIRQSETRGIKLVLILPPVRLTPSMVGTSKEVPIGPTSKFFSDHLPTTP